MGFDNGAAQRQANVHRLAGRRRERLTPDAEVPERGGQHPRRTEPLEGGRQAVHGGRLGEIRETREDGERSERGQQADQGASRLVSAVRGTW